MKILFCLALTLCSSLLARNSFAATPPYSETFEGYATGNTAVTNFTEISTGAWTIVSPSISGKGYEDAISAFSSGIGFANGVGSSSGISFPALSSSSFSLSTVFRIDSLTLTGSDVANTAAIGLFARGADDTPASSSSDRYQVSYILDDDGSGHPTGRLWLREVNVFFGDSLNILSATSLPITLGTVYHMTLGI